MVFNKFSVIHQPPGGSKTELNDSVLVSTAEGIRTIADSFSFSVVGKSKYDDFFNDGDLVKIYFATDSNAFSLVMDGVIKQINLDWDLDRKTWMLGGQNRLEILLNAPIPSKYNTTDTINKVPAIIKNIVARANNKWLQSTYGFSIGAELKSLGGFIDDQTNTIGAIPQAYASVDKPAFQQIEELSSPAWTGLSKSIGNYIYYLDSNNNFNWVPPPTTVTSTINVGNFLRAKIEKTLFDAINFAIVDAGFDFNGKPIKTYGYNNTAAIKGFRGKYFVRHDIAEGLKKSYTNAYGTEDIDGNTNNNTFRNKVRAAAKLVARQIVDTFGSPRYRVTLTMKGTTGYSKGSLYTIAIPGVFRDINDKATKSMDLRLIDVAHNFTAKGWFTDLKFEQDETTLTGRAQV